MGAIMNESQAYNVRKKFDSFGPIPVAHDLKSTASGARGPGLEKERTKLAKLEAEGAAIFEEGGVLIGQVVSDADWSKLAKRRNETRVAQNEAAVELDAKREATKVERATAARDRVAIADERWLTEAVPLVNEVLEAIAVAEDEVRAAQDRNPYQVAHKPPRIAGGGLWATLCESVETRHAPDSFPLDGRNYKLWQTGHDCVDLNGVPVPENTRASKIRRSYVGLRDVPLGVAGIENAP